MTPANIDDGKAGPDALPDNPGDVYADSAYRGDHFGKAVLARGGTPMIVATGMWGRDEAEVRARLEARNQPIHRIRGRIEKIFGTRKRSYGLRRMRWRGLAKAGVQIRLTAIAYNMKRSLKIITAAGDNQHGLPVIAVSSRVRRRLRYASIRKRYSKVN